MKVIATADLHLDINNRFEDTKAVLRQMVTYAIKNQVEQVWILGDIYDKKRPYNSEKVLFHKFVKSLADRNIKVVIISGNHDTDRYQVSAVDEFGVLDLPNVSLKENPTVIRMAEKEVYLGHFLVTGAKLGALDYTARAEMSVERILETKADLYLLGDVHKAQKLHSNPDILYVGSPERISFGERDEIKGFTLLEEVYYPREGMDNGVRLDYKFIPLKTRPMLQFDVTALDFETMYVEDDCDGAIIKIKITCTKEEYKNINEKGIREQWPTAQSVKFEYNILREDRARNSDISDGCATDEAFIKYAKEIELDNDTTDLGLNIIREA